MWPFWKLFPAYGLLSVCRWNEFDKSWVRSSGSWWCWWCANDLGDFQFELSFGPKTQSIHVYILCFGTVTYHPLIFIHIPYTRCPQPRSITNAYQTRNHSICNNSCLLTAEVLVRLYKKPVKSEIPPLCGS